LETRANDDIRAGKFVIRIEEIEWGLARKAFNKKKRNLK